MKISPMTRRRNIAPMLLLAFAAAARSQSAFADNPIVQTNYTADPAPMVHEGRLYLYTSHDEDVTVNNFFTMNDWRLYSTIDMVNWTDHGSPASYKTFSWGNDSAWAPHGIARGGKFYLYVPLNNNSGSKIGVAVADSPAGPFKDPLGKALIASGSGNIDPTVFIDADDQAYLYWGNPDLYYVKLNADMISLQGSPTKVNLTTAGFGTRSKTDRATAYEEGPWFYKRDALYYLIFPADSTPEKISYSTSSGPLGPWTFGGDIMAKQTGAGASFTNHPGIVDYKGKSYFFYHNGALPGGGGYKRSVCVEEFSYGAGGKIPTIPMSTQGPAAVEALNPFQQVEAETIAFSSGLKTETSTDTGGGISVTSISNGDYIKVKGVDFRDGVTSFDARVSGAASNAKIELHLDSQTGTLLATCDVSGASSWTTKTCPVTGGTGKHDLFLRFTGGTGDLFKFNWWKFTGPSSSNGGAGGGGGTSGAPGLGGVGGGGGGSTSVSGGAVGTTGGVVSTTGGTGNSAGGTSGAFGGSGAATAGAGQGGSPAAGGTSATLGGSGGSTLPSFGGTNAGGSTSNAGRAPTAGTSPVPPTDSSGCGFGAGSGKGRSQPLFAALLLLGIGLRRRSARAPRRVAARE